MRSLLAALALAVAAGPAPYAASPLHVCPDVPTTETASSTTLFPWTVARYDGSGPAYASVLTIPGSPAVDGMHKLDASGSWLFSFEHATDLAGALAPPAQGRDVVRYDGPSATYALFFCGASVADAVPDGSNVDAILLDGGDAGNLWVSFDVPTTIGFQTFDPGDLVAWRRTGAGCSGWSLAAANPAFDASAAGIGIPSSSNVIGAEKFGATIVVTLDVPSDLGPPGSTTFTTDEVVAWDGAAWSVWEPLSGWPAGSLVDGLAGVGNPGRVALLQVSKSAAIPGSLDLAWSASCSEGGTDYGIYEGALGSWYSHVAIGCTDAGGDLAETVPPAPGNRYYLVVPRNGAAEGSYGLRSGAIERPAGGGACEATQVITECP
ncbi:MAG TPA: hypothetical protein VF139_12550 [Candidatus Polarisedimenticolaceae bacterium]